jgi:hypothetical protein
MPINLSIKSPYVSGLNVSDTIIAAFDGASYPVKVMVTNTSSDKGLFPDVSGVVVPPHNPQSNDFAVSKKISLTSSADVAKLATNVAYLAGKLPDSTTLFVISEIAPDAVADVWVLSDNSASQQEVGRVEIANVDPIAISEYSVKALSGGQSDAIALSTTSAQTTKQAIIDAEKVAVFCEEKVFFREGTNPTALSDGTDQIIPGGVWTRISKTAGYKLAFITSSGSGTVYITPGA